jgi:hypothetical protein
MLKVHTTESSGADDELPPEMEPNRDHSPIRALIGVLACILVGVGLLGSWFFHRMEHSYSQVLDQTIRDLNNVQELALHSEAIDADILELAVTADATKRSELLRLIAEEQVANDKVCLDLQTDAASPAIRAVLQQVMITKERLQKEANAIAQRDLPGQEKTSELLPLRHLVAEFINYQKSCHDLAEQIAARSKQQNAELNGKVDHIRLCFFVLGIAPIGFGLFLLLGVLLLARATPIEMDLS